MSEIKLTSELFNQLEKGKKNILITEEEALLLKEIPKKVEPIIFACCEMLSYPVKDIVPVGSSQRNTYLPGNRDIDLFVRFDTKDRLILEKFAENAIPLIASELRTTYEIKYAENPFGVINYLLDRNEFIKIDIVATIWIAEVSELPEILKISGMARTPFHSMYLKNTIIGLEEEIRLLKYWMKQKKLYRQAGFTGFIVELLIIIYKSFISVLEHRDEMLNLIHDFFKRTPAQLTKKFPNFPIIIIDPIDKNRNAAAGIHGILGQLHLNRFHKLASMSLEQPETLWQEYNISGEMKFIIEIIFLESVTIKNEDEHYSRLIKVISLINRALKESEIEILDALIDLDSFKIELQTDTLGNGKIKRKGPPILSTNNVNKFLQKNSDCWQENGYYWTFEAQKSTSDIIKAVLEKNATIKHFTILIIN